MIYDVLKLAIASIPRMGQAKPAPLSAGILWERQCLTCWVSVWVVTTQARLKPIPSCPSLGSQELPVILIFLDKWFPQLDLIAEKFVPLVILGSHLVV